MTAFRFADEYGAFYCNPCAITERVRRIGDYSHRFGSAVAPTVEEYTAAMSSEDADSFRYAEAHTGLLCQDDRTSGCEQRCAGCDMILLSHAAHYHGYCDCGDGCEDGQCESCDSYEEEDEEEEGDDCECAACLTPWPYTADENDEEPLIAYMAAML